jgi:hypothetical protein
MFTKLRRVIVDPRLVGPTDLSTLLAVPGVVLGDHTRAP